MKGLLYAWALMMPAWGQQSSFQEIEDRSGREPSQESLEIRAVRESPAKDVGEALAKVNGIWKIRKGGIANDVVLRGFQQGNIDVLVDGFRIYGACPNHMDPAAFHVDFAEIQEVEVSKGVFDIRNEGSLGGSVNVRSKRPEQGFHVVPTVAASAFGFVNPSTTVSYASDRAYAGGGYSFRRSDPYRDGSGRRFTEYANYLVSAQNRQAFGIGTGWGQASFSPRPDQRLRFAYTRQGGGGETLYPYLLMDAMYDNADRASASYDVRRPGAVFGAIRAEAYFTRVKHWMTDERRTSSVGLPRPFSMATFAATKTAGVRLEANRGGLLAGAELYRRNWDAVNTMRMMGVYMDQHAIPNVWTTAVGGYTEYARQFGNARVTAAGRLDNRRTAASASVNTGVYQAYKGTRSLEANDTNPSANGRITYSLPGGFELFAGGGRTTRIPDAQERYFALRRGGSDWVGNPVLRPVRNAEGDLGLSFQHRWVRVRPALFYSRLDDFIVVHNQPRLNAVPGIANALARSYENVNAQMYGGEVSYDIGLSRALLLSGGASWTRGIKDPEPDRRIFDRNLAEMPPVKSRLALRYGRKRVFVELEGIAAGAQNRVDTDLREARTAGYGILNVKAGLHTKTVYFTCGVENVLDRFYYEAFSYQRDPFRYGVKVPEPGRSAYMNASYTF